MNFLPIIVVTAVVASIAWMILFRRRYAPNLESLLNQLKRPSDGHPCSRVALSLDDQRAEDDQLWTAIRGTRGLYRMFHNAGILLTLAIRMSDESYHDENAHNRDLALMIRWALFIGLLECALLNCFPYLPVPRFIARFAFDQYCELCSMVRAMIEFQNPTLIEQFDRVI